MLTAQVVPFTLPLRAPMATANGIETERCGFLFGVTDGGDVWGWGEATPMPPWSTEDAPTTGAALERWAARWCSPAGSSSVEVAGLGTRDLDVGLMVEEFEELRRFPHASAAISGALEDLAARRAGRSLGQHLRPSRHPAARVEVSVLIGGADADTLASAAVAALGSGCSTVKIKMAAAAPSVDVDRIAAVRNAVGPAIGLRLDANGGWDQATAISTLRALEPHDIEMCEEPVGGLDALAAVRRSVGIPIAIDESLDSVATLEAAITKGAADVVVCKPQALGGPRPAIDLADRASEAGLPVVVTSFVDGTIGLVTALHVASLLPTSSPAHGLATSSLLATDNAPPLKILNGALDVPTGLGLGTAPTL